MKGGISMIRYNQLNFLSKLYYNFMCFFNINFCLDPTNVKYNANRKPKRRTSKRRDQPSLNLDPANGNYIANRKPNRQYENTSGNN